MFAEIKNAAFLATALHFSGVLGHGFVRKITIDGVDFPGANPFIPGGPPSIVWPYTGGNGPLNDVNSPDITCNKISGPAQISAPAKAGAKMTIDWNGSSFWPAGDTGLGPNNHHGPVMTYLAKCPGPCAQAVPQQLTFVKFQELSRIEAGPVPGVWGSDVLTKDGSTITMNLPQGLESGEYVMRHEILALHNAPAKDPQFYPVCASLTITGDGSAPLPEAQGIKLPGGYRADDPSLSVNIFDGSLEKQDYVAPGPRVFTSAARRVRRDDFACQFAHSNRRDLADCHL